MRTGHSIVSQRNVPYVLLLPFVLLFALFGVFPLLFSFYLAFHTWEPTSGLGEMELAGWGNFAFVIQDPWFWKTLGNTAWLAIASGVPQHLVAIPLACALHALSSRWRDAGVGVYFLPYITTTVAVAILFTALLSTDYGLVNLLLKNLQGLPLIGAWMPQPVDWLNDPDAVKPAIAILVFWRYLGFNTVLYLAALQTIPKDLYEAAALDGATAWQRFRHITLPGLKSMALFGVTLSLIGGLQLFEEPFVLTNGTGGADQSGMTSAMYLYRTAFDFNDFGAASAMSWLLFVVVAALTWLVHRAFGKPGDAA
jgi:multiple sugar transport system permease protein